MAPRLNAVAIIPARGGSQRLPRKNIYPVLGQPMLAWSVQAATDCAYLGPGAVFVTTDDDEIAAVAAAAGAGVIRRPADLAGANWRAEPVIHEALGALQ